MKCISKSFNWRKKYSGQASYYKPRYTYGKIDMLAFPKIPFALSHKWKRSEVRSGRLRWVHWWRWLSLESFWCSCGRIRWWWWRSCTERKRWRWTEAKTCPDRSAHWKVMSHDSKCSLFLNKPKVPSLCLCLHFQKDVKTRPLSNDIITLSLLLEELAQETFE